MFRFKAIVFLLIAFIILLILPFACTAQNIKGSQLRDGTVTINKVDTTGFPFVKINKNIQQPGYFNIQTGYLDALYFQSSGTVNASGQLLLAAGDNMLISSGVDNITIQSGNDINIEPTGNLRVKNIITDDPGNGTAPVLMGRIVTGSDSQPYWEVSIDGTVYYIPALTTLP